MAFLKIKNLSHQFSNGVMALKEINLSFQEGAFVIIAGANGSGKTVLVRHFNGLLKPSTGEVLLENKNIFEDLVHTRTKIGLVFQDPDSQFVGQTVKEDVSFGPENLKLPEEIINERVKNALAVVGLSNLSERRPDQLSGGEKRRLAIAGVLAMHPKVIIFDEPFAGLDYAGVLQVLEQIIKLHEAKKTIFVITHDLEKIAAHASRLIIMNTGNIVLDGRPEDIIDKVNKHGIRIPYGSNRDINTMTWLK